MILKETQRFKSLSKRNQNIVTVLPIIFSGVPLILLLISIGLK